MAEAPEEFASLLARARQGEREALARLAEQYEPKVRVVARVLLGPALRPYLDSLDLVQSVHRSLMIGLRGDKFELNSPENLIALAVTMIRRKAARHWRHLRRQYRGKGEELPELLASLTSAEPDPARQAEVRDAVGHLCESLSEMERRLLEMRSQGCTTGEVAEQLGLNPIALRVRLSRLRQRLQECGVLSDWL